MPAKIAADIDEATLVSWLTAIQREAEDGRKDRDAVWAANWQTYWQAFDYSKKLKWQFRAKVPEAAHFVERFAAAIRDALIRAGDDWFTVEMPTALTSGVEPDLAAQLEAVGRIAKAVVVYWLNQQMPAPTGGGPRDFFGLVEDIFKDGALMLLAASVTWRVVEQPRIQAVDVAIATEDPETGERVTKLVKEFRRMPDRRAGVVVEPVDPRTLWLDARGRGLYRRRRIELDLHELKAMARQLDADGEPIWNAEAVERVQGMRDEQLERARAESAGSPTRLSAAVQANRRPVILDEYLLAALVNEQGAALAENVLVVVADERHVVRGPEINPFLHGQDWILTSPIIRTPHSVYGRTYLEASEPMIRAFNEFTNVLLDAGLVASGAIVAGDPTVLEDPDEVKEGIVPNKYYTLEAGHTLEEFIQQLQIGNVRGDLFQIWNALKAEAQEGALLNDILLGNLPQRGERTATEIQEATAGAGAFIRSIAANIENNFFEPLLQRVWDVALQHMDSRADPDSLAHLPDAFAPILDMPDGLRAALINGPFKFKVQGISGVLARDIELRRLLGAFQVLAGSRDLMQALLLRVDPTKLLRRVMAGFGLDLSDVELPPEEVERRRLEAEAMSQQRAAENSAEAGAAQAAQAVARAGAGAQGAPGQPAASGNGGIPPSG